jgi:hypothetical protein
MKKSNMDKRMAEVVSSGQFHRISNLVLSVAVVLLVITVLNNEPVTQIIPPKLDERITMSVNMADSGYKKAWAKYVAILAGNVTPANVQFVSDSIGELLAPDVYHRVSGELGSLVFTVQKEARRTTFIPKRVLYEEASDKVFIEGDFEILLPSDDALNPATRRGRNTMTKVYEIAVDIENGAPLVKHFDTYFGPMKTVDYLERQNRLTREVQG